MKKYKLDGHAVVPCADILEWAQWFETADRRVALDVVDGFMVSTVFLGLDHSFGEGPPLVFESAVFSPESKRDMDECVRTSTWEEAEFTHAGLVAGLLAERASAECASLAPGGDRCELIAGHYGSHCKHSVFWSER